MNFNTILSFTSLILVLNSADCQNLTCPTENFKCQDGSLCLSKFSTCDGISDCTDKSDESAAVCQNNVCAPGQFTCNYGACIEMSSVCDTIIDCADLSDERNCDLTTTTTKCGLGMVGCRSGDECIRLDQKCDGQRDCRDNSDETFQTCSSIQCPSSSYQCKYGACIEQSLVCDGKHDCADGSDENLPRCKNSIPENKLKKCVSDDFLCNSGICIKTEKLCDGYRDCDDGSDETAKTCKNTLCNKKTHFQCNYGACIPFQKLTCEHCVDRSYKDAKCGTQGRDELTEKPPSGPSIIAGGFAGGQVDIRPPAYEPITTTTRPGEEDKIHFAPKCQYPIPPAFGTYQSSIKSGVRAGVDAPEWTVLKFSCQDGYGLSNFFIVVCVDGQWNAEFPVCLPKCPPLESESHEIECKYKNREANCSNAIEGTIASIKCKDAYEVENTILQPYNVIRCHKRSWSKVLFDCKPECGTLIPKGQALVVSGYTATKGEFPWHAGLYEWKGDEFQQICGGTLITEKIIITAAHCFWDWFRNKPKTNPEKYAVAVGKFYRSWNHTKDLYVQKFSIEQISIPKKFRADESSFANDIALILLNDTVKFSALVRPICTDWSNTLQKYFLKPGIEGSVVGWGLTEEYGEAAEELQAVHMPYIEFDNCLNEVPQTFRPFLTYDKICGGFTNGTSLCTGDSGGGYAFRKNNRFFIEGIVSVAPAKGPTCDSYKYAAFTKIGEHLNWLIDLQQNLDTK